MNLAELLELVPDENKEAAEAFIASLTTKIKNLSDEVAELEQKASNSDDKEKLADAIKKRDAAKAQLTVVRDALGLPADKEITAELVTSHVKDGSKGDAEKDKIISNQRNDIQGLEELVDSQKTAIGELEGDLAKTQEESKFVKVFAESMPSFKPASPVARSQIESLLRKDAVLEEGEIMYKGKDDSYIRVEGEKMTMKTRLGQIQDDQDYAFLFETEASGGSGSGNNGGSGSGSRFEQRKRAAGIR